MRSPRFAVAGVALFVAALAGAATGPPSLSGTVYGPDRQPIAGARVVAWQAGRDERPDLEARSGRDGSFRLPLTSRGAFRLRVEAPGFASFARYPVLPGALLLVTLETGRELEGIVRDARTGAGVPGARVEARDGGPSSPPWDPALGSVRATTGADGRFRLEHVSRGLQDFIASGRGYRASWRKGVDRGPVEILLFPGAGIAGTVVGPDGKPIAGSVVRVETPRGVAVPVGPETSDARGRFEVLGLAAGTFRLVVRHPGFAPALVTGITLAEGASRTLGVTLERGARATAQLVDAQGQPVRGRIELRDLDGEPLGSALRVGLRGEAGADGRIEIARLPSGKHTLLAVAPGYARKTATLKVNPRESLADLGSILLTPAPSLRGTVRDTSAAPIEGAVVRALASDAVGTGLGEEEVTAADGSFALVGLAPGRYRLQATAPGYGQAVREAQVGGPGAIDIVLAAAGSIVGRVVDGSGKPVEAFNVAARPARRQLGPLGMPSTTASIADARGRFELSDVGEGSYVLEVSAPSFRTRTVARVEVPAGGTKDVGEIALEPGGTVRGRVVDAQGDAVAGASVSALGPSGRPSFGWGPQAESDAGGAFELSGVPPGRLELVATHPDYSESRVRGLTIDPTEGPLEVDVVLVAGGKVEGKVLRRDGTGIAGVPVQAVPLEAATNLYYSPLSGTQTTDGQGFFAIEHLPVGRTRVTASGRADGAVVRQSVEVEVRSGQTATVDLVSRAVLVTGRVTRGGDPAPGLRVRVQGNPSAVPAVAGLAEATDRAANGDAPEISSSLTGESGDYRLYVEEPGSARVEIESADGATRFPTRTAVIEDVPLQTLDLEIPAATSSGIVLDERDGHPLPGALVTAIARRAAGPSGLAASTATTDSEGRFRMDLEAGEYALEARLRGYAPGRADLGVTGDGGSATIELERDSALVGRVERADGAGVAGVSVFAAGAGGLGSAVTGAEGAFRVENLPAGSYTLVAGSPAVGFALASGAGDEEVVLPLGPGGRVHVRVRGLDGAPEAGAVVRVVSVAGVLVPADWSAALTDREGLADLAAPAGNLLISVRAGLGARSLPIDLTNGGVREVEIGPGKDPATRP